MSQPTSDIDATALQAMAADAGILDTFGLQVVRASDGVCELTCTVPAQLVNAGGFAHGAIAYAMLDTAAAYALNASGRRGVTSNGNISYVSAASAGTRLRAQVAVLSSSRRVANMRGEVYGQDDGDADERLIAHGTFVFQLRVEPT